MAKTKADRGSTVGSETRAFARGKNQEVRNALRALPPAKRARRKPGRSLPSGRRRSRRRPLGDQEACRLEARAPRSKAPRRVRCNSASASRPESSGSAEEGR